MCEEALVDGCALVGGIGEGIAHAAAEAVDLPKERIEILVRLVHRSSFVIARFNQRKRSAGAGEASSTSQVRFIGSRRAHSDHATQPRSTFPSEQFRLVDLHARNVRCAPSWRTLRQAIRAHSSLS